MMSRIYIGEVAHARQWPVKHAFRYPVYFYGLDVDELPSLSRQLPLFGYNQVRIASVNDRDYLEPGNESLRAKAEKRLATAGVPGPFETIYLITAARFLNYVFSPASFLYCYREGNELAAVIAFVNNTFGESHIYALHEALPPRAGYVAHFQMQKQFHVSPFFDMVGRYDFHFAEPGDDAKILLQLTKHDQIVFSARLTGTGQELTTRSMLRTFIRYPLIASITFPRILWQAARLYYQRKLPVFHRPYPESPDTVRFVQPSLTRRLARRLVLSTLQKAEHSSVEIVMPDRSGILIGDAAAVPAARVHVKHHDFFWRILTAGDTGLGESYVAGDWSCRDVTGFLAFLIQNMNLLSQQHPALALPKRALDRIRHLLRSNTLRGSRKNIHTHYDLSNEFFQIFLDESMTYSCAVFENEKQSLAEAQRNKLRSIIRKAEIGPEDHVLEVGCGWGSFAIQAVRETGCRVTGLTVSGEQYRLARERVVQEGLVDSIDIRLCDYRHIDGQYDRVVSIEMLEAVGHQYLGTYFSALDRALKPGGRAVIQVITIPDQRYDTYRRSTDWINKHIFPGGHLPSLAALCTAATQHSTLGIQHVENIGDHYATTLQKWREAFVANADDVVKLGFDDAFLRKWEYYLAYCEAGFQTRVINNLQLVLRRAGES